MNFFTPPGGSSGGASAWGQITGTLSNQTDLQAALDAKAGLASPALSGVPTAPTAAPGTNTTQVATTAFVAASAASGVVSFNSRTGAVSPASADYSVAQVTGAAPLASPTFTGTPAAPTPSASDNSTKIATTAYVDTADALKANLASPALTGNPTAPTQTAGNNSTRLATTAYVDSSRAMTLISDQLLGGAAATVTFSSIPATYKHLKLIIECRSSVSANGDTAYFQANGDTTLNYAVQQVYGNNASPSAGQNLSATADIMEVSGANTLAGDSAVAECMFINYAGTTFLKRATVLNGLTLGASVTGNMFALYKVWRWGNTSAISSLVIGLASAANFVTGSRFTLYGLS